MRRRLVSTSLVIAAVLIGFALALWWQKPDGGEALLRDDAALLDDMQRARIEAFHGYLRLDHGIDYRLITGRGLGDINLFALQAFEEHFATAKGRGLLLVLDPETDLLRLEVGYDLEGVFPDAFIAYVEQRQMVPFFEQGRVADGILATTELIVTRAQRALANAGFEGEAWLAGSGGGGATTTARLGAGSSAPETTGSQVGPGSSPSETLQRYFEVLARRDTNPGLELYTPESRRMLADWLATRAQMDNLLRTYRRCGGVTLRTAADGRRAVLRYPPRDRQCAPFFFEKNAAGWQLDLTMMQRAIRFGRNNAWRLDPNEAHPYGFAFKDWQFDRHGFPKDPS